MLAVSEPTDCLSLLKSTIMDLQQEQCARCWSAIPAAQAGVRLDGRRNDEVLPAHAVSGAVQQAPASAEVRMGDTHVLATARVRDKYSKDKLVFDSSDSYPRLQHCLSMQVSVRGPRQDDASSINVSVFLAPGSYISEQVCNAGLCII
jgi:hypothetical protein